MLAIGGLPTFGSPSQHFDAFESPRLHLDLPERFPKHLCKVGIIVRWSGHSQHFGHFNAFQGSEIDTAHPRRKAASERQMAVVVMGAAVLAALLVIFAGLIGRRASRNRKGIVLPEDVDALVWREEKGQAKELIGRA